MHLNYSLMKFGYPRV